MINDSLIQLGRELEEEKRKIRHTTEKITRVGATVEKCMDKVGILHTYRMEFCTYGEQTVVLDIRIFEKYKDLIYG